MLRAQSHEGWMQQTFVQPRMSIMLQNLKPDIHASKPKPNLWPQ